jgi:hypothetical protein
MNSTWNGVHNMFWETRMGVNNRKKWMIMEDIYLGSMVGMKYGFFPWFFMVLKVIEHPDPMVLEPSFAQWN